MCRSIKTLYRSENPVVEAEVTAAALQYVRKISGYRKPSAGTRLPLTGGQRSGRCDAEIVG